jgi:hypothetical protein
MMAAGIWAKMRSMLEQQVVGGPLKVGETPACLASRLGKVYVKQFVSGGVAEPCWLGYHLNLQPDN